MSQPPLPRSKTETTSQPEIGPADTPRRVVADGSSSNSRDSLAEAPAESPAPSDSETWDSAVWEAAVDGGANPEDSEAEDSANPARPRTKIYGLPIKEVEELLSLQQQTQALSFKIVRHLRAGEDKIASIRAEKQEVDIELAETRARLAETENELLEALQQAQKLEALERELSAQRQRNQELTLQLETRDQQHLQFTKQWEQQTALLEASKKKLVEYGNLKTQLTQLQQSLSQESQERGRLAEQLAAAQAQAEQAQGQLESAKTEREELTRLIKLAMTHLEKNRQQGPAGKQTSPTSADKKPS